MQNHKTDVAGEGISRRETREILVQKYCFFIVCNIFPHIFRAFCRTQPLKFFLPDCFFASFAPPFLQLFYVILLRSTWPATSGLFTLLQPSVYRFMYDKTPLISQPNRVKKKKKIRNKKAMKGFFVNLPHYTTLKPIP